MDAFLKKEDLLNSLILGLGNEYNGDDAVGPYIVNHFRALGYPNFWNVGVSIENYIFKIAAQPEELIYLIDAIDFEAEPGEISLFAPEDLSGGGISTHSLNAAMAFGILEGQGKQVRIIGIQPERIGFGLEMSETVLASAQNLIKKWEEELNA